MDRMFREMDRTFDQLRSTWLQEFGPSHGDEERPDGRRRPALEAGADWNASAGFGLEPAATLEDEGDAYVYVMDLPGFETADIDLRFHDGALSIRAHADVDERTDAHRAVRSRRVSRRVPVPAEIAVEEIAASYHNGVLEVTLPVVDDDRREPGHRIDLE
ncbi:heat shock protein Hsp20 [Natronolimnohabitans innermongolicus JCM 12255]|uniref:Heat shock protein Hsp20 n=2 Tax=Natronolimnohabitans innermongolicus TaxID=253107 RepID=L9WZP2_9EURY|nr:heat shock protein Hsp20 [Natronolimnohabitans innermongolicus JCM 12255]